MITLSRRKLLGGLGLLIAAPAIVKASSLMPVKAYAARAAERLYVGDLVTLEVSRDGLTWVRATADTPIDQFIGVVTCFTPHGIETRGLRSFADPEPYVLANFRVGPRQPVVLR